MKFTGLVMTTNTLSRFVFPAVLGIALAAGIVDARASGWLATGDLNEARSGHTMMLLPDGHVLAVGGASGGVRLASAELYDAGSGSWALTGAMATPRGGHSATLLPNGLMLVAGGYSDSGALASAELYDPSTGAWRSTGNLHTPRGGHSATLLENGSVLVVGGCCDQSELPQTSLTSAEIYDPVMETWTPTMDMTAARSSHSATLLADGSVLVAGGLFYRTGTLSSVEIYDPGAGSWQNVGPMSDARAQHGATILPDGSVLVMGGTPGGCCSGVPTAEVFDPTLQAWYPVGAMVTGRRVFTTTPLADGTVLVAGGYSCCLSPDTIKSGAEIYDADIQQWASAGDMLTPRYLHAAVRLEDGSILVAGGLIDTGNAASRSAEIFEKTNTPPPNQHPTAAFNSVCTGLDCTFTDDSADSDGTVTGWSWTFGDSGSSSERNPSHTYAAAGTYRVTLTVTDGDGAAGTLSKDVIVPAGTSPPVEESFASIAAEDGWVRESNESSGVGGSRNAGGNESRAIRMGDHRGDQQYKSILSFDTSSIPDGATITGARLELTRGGITGQNPFNTHGTCSVDIKTGGFSGNAALENGDFQASADLEQVAQVSNQGGSGKLYRVDLDAAIDHINKAGRTQLRLYFATDDNDDGGTDIAGFYSANNGNAARRPRLIVEYQGDPVDPLTPTTHHPQAIDITAGSYDWGTLESFTNQDDDTYDIASAPATDGSVDGGATGWEVSTTISSAPEDVRRITLHYAGQYSIHSVSQEFYLHNYETGAWDLLDTRLVGQGNDLNVVVEIADNPQRYVSSAGEMRARVSGFHPKTQDFYVWANYLAWEVEGAGN